MRVRELNLSALSDEEVAYLLGLYLADGSRYATKNRRTGSISYYVDFLFQGDQGEIAEKVVGMLKALGLTPYKVKPSRGEWMFVVRVVSKALFSFLPSKKSLREDAVMRERFFSGNGFFGVERGVPFVAGLLDGDGAFTVSLDKSCSYFGSVSK